MKKIFFVAWTFCLAAAALFSGSMALYENLTYRFNGRSAVMELADSSKPITLPVGGYDVHLLNVRYVGASGEVLVPQKRLLGNVARKIASGEKIPVTYLRSDPQRVMYANDELANPWWGLTIGLALSATFVYALKLMRREASQ